MQRHSGERGYALILLLGIIATLLILSVSLVMVLGNEQGSTAMERSTKTSLYFGEAALNSAVAAVKGTNSWLTTPFNDSTAQAAMAANYNTLPGSPPSVTYLVYDNASPINYATNYDANGDGKVWVEVVTTYQGRTTRVRELVQSSTTVSILPRAAAYTDTNLTCSGTSNLYGVKDDGSPDNSGAPYLTSIMVGDDFSANSSTTLASPGYSTQSLGLQVNGSVSTPGHNFSPTIGGVGLLSDYFDQAHQAALTAEAQACLINASTLFNASAPVYTSASALLAAMTYNSGTKTYTATTDLRYSSSTTLTLNTAGTTYNFQKLYVTGNLTLGGTTTTNTTALYVSGNFTISGPTSTNKFGPIYVGGDVSWKGPSSGRLGVQTTNYLNANAAPSPMYAKIFSVDGNISGDNSDYDGSSGLYDLVLGPTWIDGDAGTGDIAVNFSGPSSPTQPPTVLCPLLATTEKTVSNGKVTIGTLTSPMVYYMQCDNDGLYSNTCEWASTGTFTGLMVLFEAPITLANGVRIVGAVLEGTPVANETTMSGDASISYNQTVINNVSSDSLRTTTTTTVPGTWQQLTSQ
jgi:hypothetical protein